MCHSGRPIPAPAGLPSSTPQKHKRGAYAIFVSDDTIPVKPYFACGIHSIVGDRAKFGAASSIQRISKARAAISTTLLLSTPDSTSR